MTAALKQDEKKLWWWLLGWGFLNGLQSIFLDITPDEAYYYMYAQHLDWGYFDHPPMMAVLIKIGYSLIPNVLGVRLLFILMGTVAIYLLWRITKPRNLTLFGMIVGATAMVHIASFHAIPDVPLIFFTVVYLFLIQRYLERPKWTWAIAIGLTIACLLWSKYHGFLVILFTLIAYPKFVLKRDFWLILATVTIALLPHFFWQLNHDFPSLTYHLSDRNIKPYTFLYVVQYWLSQPIIIGPLMGIVLVYGAWKTTVQTTFDRISGVLLWGTFIFFGLAALRAYVLPHWTAIAMIPLLIKGILYFDTHHSTYYKKIKITFIASIVLIGLGRLIAFYDFIPQSVVKHDHLHHWATWADEIQAIAKEQPVVFVNSYEAAAKYNFYTGQVGFSLNNVAYRRNQYDYLNFDEALLGQKILFLSDSPIPNCDTLHTAVDKTYYTRWIDNFVSFPRTRITSNIKKYTISTKDTIFKIPIQVDFPYTTEQFTMNTNFPTTLSYHWYKNGRLYAEKTTDILISEVSRISDSAYLFPILLPSEKGQYHLKIGVATGWFPPLHSSDIFKIEVGIGRLL